MSFPLQLLHRLIDVLVRVFGCLLVPCVGSAVDAHVGAHIFSRLLCKELDGRTRVLVTNQVGSVDCQHSVNTLSTLLGSVAARVLHLKGVVVAVAVFHVVWTLGACCDRVRRARCNTWPPATWIASWWCPVAKSQSKGRIKS